MIDAHAWAEALDAVAQEMIDAAGPAGPPVDALRLAGNLKMPVLLDCEQTTRARHKRLAGRPSIFVRPDPRPERLQWAVAHEIGEHAAHRVFEQLAVAGEHAGSIARERVANGLAARLLMPAAWFAHDARCLDFDLLLLKERYSTASHESIAWRMLDLGAPCVMTVFDHNRLTWRRSNAAGTAVRLHPIERQCQAEVHDTAAPRTMQSAALTIQGWPVHEVGWRREILRASARFEADHTDCEPSHTEQWDVAQLADC